MRSPCLRCGAAISFESKPKPTPDVYEKSLGELRSKILVRQDVRTPKSREAVAKSIQAGIRHQEKFSYQHWAVIEIKTEKLIGACGFNHTAIPGELELVFHFEKNSWGNGFATEAAKACVEFAIEKLNPRKIIAGCHPDNAGSKKVLLKLGFIFVGNQWIDDFQREEPCFELNF